MTDIKTTDRPGSNRPPYEGWATASIYRDHRLWVILVSIVFSLPGCQPDSPSTPVPIASRHVSPVPEPSIPSSIEHSTSEARAVEISRLIAARLKLMTGVAKAKWNRNLPISDPKREQTQLDQLVLTGGKLQLPTGLIVAFFRAQIDVGKSIQQQAFDEWKERQQGPFDDAPDLERTIRPQIDDLNQKLLDALKRCRDHANASDWNRTLERAATDTFTRSDLPGNLVDAVIEPLRSERLLRQ